MNVLLAVLKPGTRQARQTEGDRHRDRRSVGSTIWELKRVAETNWYGYIEQEDGVKINHRDRVKIKGVLDSPKTIVQQVSNYKYYKCLII